MALRALLVNPMRVPEVASCPGRAHAARLGVPQVQVGHGPVVPDVLALPEAGGR